MTPQERQLLQDFLNQLTQARNTVKDPEADGLIARAAAQQPDAIYLLVQRALLLEQALNNAKTQIAQLQSQTGSGTNGSFLSSSGWGSQSQSQSQTLNPPYSSAQNAPRTGLFGGSTGSFLGTMAATAAGVAGGAFLFQGIENLLGHHNSNSSHGQSSLLDSPTESAQVNDRYADNDSSDTQADNNDLDSLADVDLDGSDSGDDSSWS